jgi:hypothetical protein
MLEIDPVIPELAKFIVAEGKDVPLPGKQKVVRYIRDGFESSPSNDLS